MIPDTLPYTAPGLDRAGPRRTDEGWIAALRAHPASTCLALWRDRCLVTSGAPVTVPVPDDAVLLGVNGDVGVFAIDLSDLDADAALAAAAAESTMDIRHLFPALTPDTAARLGYAKGLLRWHREQRFCGACGSPAASANAGHLRVCGGCGKLLFPCIEPAVITLVTWRDTCLLARHAGASEDAFSTLAGFVEVGESLEDAVRREVMEEAGVRVGRVSYQGSQPWPFPSGLMVGFRGEATDPAITVDGDELLEARWFTRTELTALLDRRHRSGSEKTDSISRYLVTDWLGDAV